MELKIFEHVLMTSRKSDVMSMISKFDLCEIDTLLKNLKVFLTFGKHSNIFKHHRHSMMLQVLTE